MNLDRALKDTCFWVLDFIELRKKKERTTFNKVESVVCGTQDSASSWCLRDEHSKR